MGRHGGRAGTRPHRLTRATLSGDDRALFRLAAIFASVKAPARRAGCLVAAICIASAGCAASELATSHDEAEDTITVTAASTTSTDPGAAGDSDELAGLEENG